MTYVYECCSEENHILLDCGEGTYGQIVRHSGFVRAEEILANLNIIFISHLHADHHIGLINILKQRRNAAKLHDAKLKKVFLLAPKTILFWLVSYQQQFEEIFDCVEFIANQDLVSIIYKYDNIFAKPKYRRFLFCRNTEVKWTTYPRNSCKLLLCLIL